MDDIPNITETVVLWLIDMIPVSAMINASYFQIYQETRILCSS